MSLLEGLCEMSNRDPRGILVARARLQKIQLGATLYGQFTLRCPLDISA
jgi:hypothetical protein